MKPNDEMIKTSIFRKCNLMIEKIDKILYVINKRVNLDYKLPNIATTYNNKLVDIVALYRRNNMSFYSSHLKWPIEGYLLSYVDEATSILNRFTTLVSEASNTFPFSKKRAQIFDELQNLLKNYLDLDTKLYDFDISKDIVMAIDADIEHNKELEKKGEYNPYSSSADEIIKSYNDELKSLGINQTYNKPIATTNSQVINERIITSELIKKVYSSKQFEISEFFRSKNIDVPIISSALQSQVLNYADDAAKYFSENNIDQCKILIDRMDNFNIEKEMTEAIGKYICNLSDENEMHNINEWILAKAELEKIGFSNLIPQIEQYIKNNYKEEIESRKKN